MMSSQPMKNLIPGIQPIREFLHVMCAVGATMATKPQNFIEYPLGVILGLLVHPSFIRVSNRNSSFDWNSVTPLCLVIELMSISLPEE